MRWGALTAAEQCGQLAELVFRISLGAGIAATAPIEENAIDRSSAGRKRLNQSRNELAIFKAGFELQAGTALQ